MIKRLSTFAALLTLFACSSPGAVGEACSEDADCEDGLECHVETAEGEEADADAEGTCEEAGAHDHDDHEGEDHDDEDDMTM